MFVCFQTDARSNELRSDSTTDCDPELTRTVDDFDGEIRILASIRNYNWDGISFLKYISKKSTRYYLKVEIKSYGIHFGNGVFFILSNGKRFSKPNVKVETDYDDGDYFTTAFFQLTQQEMLLFSNSGIDKYKVYIHTGNFTLQSEKISELATCILKAK
jgi:hypothetical protein